MQTQTITCAFDGCSKPMEARGFCHTHYSRWYRNGTTALIGQKRTNVGTCAIAGCERPVEHKPWCDKHYRRWLHHGDPTRTLRMTSDVGLAERMKHFTQKTELCWLWAGTRTTAGYGVVRWQGQLHYAHRVSYERANGPIPDSTELDHLCRTKACVKPAHLEAVLHSENTRRARMTDLTAYKAALWLGRRGQRILVLSI